MLSLPFPSDRPVRLLCLGAHSDDIEIGCGGSLLSFARKYPLLQVVWVVFTAQGDRRLEASNSADSFLKNVQEKEVVLESFRDGFLPYMGGEVKDYFESLKKRVTPDLIFTHYRQDLHQDHRLICDLTWNTWRNHLILEYEIPKYDGDLGVPNFFVHLDERTANRKTSLLMQHFGTQRSKDWFSEETFLGLMRLRGVESKAPEKYAEGFYCRKMIFG